MSFIRNRSSPAATTARFAMPLSEKKILSPVSRIAAGLRALRGSFVARGFWGRDKLEITLSRARSPRLRLIDFFQRPASRPCSPFSAWDVGDRDRENRDGALERLGTKKPRRERGKRPPLDATRLRHTKVGIERILLVSMITIITIRWGRRGTHRAREGKKGGQLAVVRDALSVACNCCLPKLDPVRLTRPPDSSTKYGCRP